MGDRIQLTGIRAWGHHGVFEAERLSGQEFIVDVAMDVDTRPAAESDDLAATVDYGTVAGEVVALIGGQPVDLIETLAERIAASTLAHAGVKAVTVTVHKPQAPIDAPVADISVSITRMR